MPPKFGTSGLRGLVKELTDPLIEDHVMAFALACDLGNGVFVGRDLRDSSPHIAATAMSALQRAGINVTDCGPIATPALAMSAMDAGNAAIMVTGSHIPSDRNGIKFYTPTGEITKDHEAAILANLGKRHEYSGSSGEKFNAEPEGDFISRYVSGFGSSALLGSRIGVYSHSTVGRDLLQSILTQLGATVTELGRSKSFIPVDTEAVDPETRDLLRRWANDHEFDCIVSMDGDGDRPLLTDEHGEVIPGDVVGQITARFLGANYVVTPVSSNSAVEQMSFKAVHRTKIGSPFVIKGMDAVGGNVVGYEANGGFLLGFNAQGPSGEIAPLMTRDSILPVLSVLTARSGKTVSQFIDSMPQRFTAADRLQNIETSVSSELVARIRADPNWFAGLFNQSCKHKDETDGPRITFEDGTICHIRPSGNAPELRVYVEAHTKTAAVSMLSKGLNIVRALVS